MPSLEEDETYALEVSERQAFINAPTVVGILRGLETFLQLLTADASGYELRSTLIAVADEIAGAAELVRPKASGIPAAVVRGLDVAGEGAARELVMPAERDLFR